MRKALIAASALVLAVTVGACGETESGTPVTNSGTTQNTGQGGVFDDAQSLVEAATQRTAEAKTSRFNMDISMGSLMSIKAEGQAEYAGEDTKMAMTMSMDMSGTPGASGAPQQLNVEAVLVDKAMYMKMPQGMPGADASKPWVKMSMDQLGGQQQLNQSMQFSDPAETLAMIRENGKINSTEQTTVDGQPATKYSVELDFKKLADKMGQQLPAGLDIDAVPMDLYLNGDNLPVQIDMNLGSMMKNVAEKSGQPLPPGLDSAKITAKYTNWGEPVDIKAPPADQVNEGMPGAGSIPTTPN